MQVPHHRLRRRPTRAAGWRAGDSTPPSETPTPASDKRTPASDTRTPPSETRTLPSETRTPPSDIRTLPSDTRTLPSETRALPSETRSLRRRALRVGPRSDSALRWNRRVCMCGRGGNAGYCVPRSNVRRSNVRTAASSRTPEAAPGPPSRPPKRIGASVRCGRGERRFSPHGAERRALPV